MRLRYWPLQAGLLITLSGIPVFAQPNSGY